MKKTETSKLFIILHYSFFLIFLLLTGPRYASGAQLLPSYTESIQLSKQHADNPVGWVPADNSIIRIPGDGSTDAQYGLKYDAGGNLIVRTASKSEYYHGNYVGQPNYKIYGTATKAAAWVTTGNDTTSFLLANGVTGSNVTKLLERGLGINDTGDHDAIIEYTLDAKNDLLMRPTKNPDIRSYSVNPNDYGTAAAFQQPGDMAPAVYNNFTTYYNNWKQDAYDNSTFPWTQIGYTFFWGNGYTLPDIQGQSEFIILGQTVVNIHSIYSTRSYIYTRNDGTNFSTAAGSQYGNGFASFNIDGSCDTVWAGHRFQKNVSHNVLSPNQIIVGNTGSVSGGSGLLVWSLNYDVNNSGVISGATTQKFGVAGSSNIAVLFEADTTATYGTPVLAGSNTLTNSGTIQSPGIAIQAKAGNTTITNNANGVISGGVYAILTGAGNDNVTINGGQLSGGVDLGGGVDTFSVTGANNDAQLGLVVNTDTGTPTQISNAETVNIANNTTLAVNVTGSKNIQGNETYQIVNTNALNVDTSQIIVSNDATLPMVSFTAQQSGNILLLKAVRNNSYYANSCSNSSLGSALDTIAQSATGDMANLIEELDKSGDPNNARQFEPVVDNGVPQMSYVALNRHISTIIDHIHDSPSGQTGVSTGESFSGLGTWAQGYGSYLHQGPRGSSDGYNATVWGTLGGFDLPLNNDFRIGLCGGFSQCYINPRDKRSNTNADSYQTSLYAAFDKNPFYIDGVFSFAYNEYDSSRNISFSSVNRTAKSDYGGQQYLGYLEGGYRLNLDKITVTPLISMEYMHLRLNSYTETGANAANLEQDAQNFDMVQSGLGIRADYHITTKHFSFIPEFHFKWLYDYVGDSQQATSAFTGGGPSFNTNGFRPAQSSYNFGTKLTLITVDNISLTLNYDFGFKEDFYNHSGYAKIRFVF